MKNKGMFAIPSLLAAGLVPLSVSHADDAAKADEARETILDGLAGIVTGIEESHTFTLAGHSSHGSHASHGSHGSHRSASYRVPAVEPDVTLAALSGRNADSTPPISVLPSSPAITRKLKVLPGNSGKFQELVQRAQLALLAKGYEVGTVDGEVHAKTVAALYRYQTDQGMIPSGKLTSDTLSSLGIMAQ